MLHRVFLSFGLIHDALPDCGTGTRVVVGMRDVLECQRICLALHRLRDVAVVDDVRHDDAEVRTCRRAEDRHVEAATRTFCRMVFLPMPHLVPEHDGNLVVTRQDAEEPCVDAHVVPERAEGIEALVLIDEVVVGLVVDRRIDRADCCRQVRHDGVDLVVVVGVVVDAVLLLHLLEELLAAFFGVIVLLEERCELCMRCRALNASADDASPPKLRMGDWCRGEPVRAGNHDHTRCEDGDDSFLQGFLDFHNAHPSTAEVLCHQTVLKMYPLDLAGSLLL